MKSSENIMQSKLDEKNIKNDPVIVNLLARMPKDVANSFNDKQLSNLMIAVGSREWKNHAIDIRGTFKIPFYKWRFYYVLLVGRNFRELSRKEKQISIITTAIFSVLFLMFSTALGILVLYLIKSALGIDIIPGYSFGVWDWFKGLW